MEFFDFIFHIDIYLANAVSLFEGWIYAILFVIIFAETGLVIAPFLPGDSLLFAAGTLSGAGLLNVWTVYIVVLIAAILGDAVNYWIGHYIGPKAFAKENSRFFKKAYLEKTRQFFEKHGGKTIVIARFLPILRTFAPFVAGIGKMQYRSFCFYNILGAFIWATSFIFAGFYLGSLPLIKENFKYAISGIIIISFMPLVIEYIKYRRGPEVSKKQLENANYKDIQKIFKKEKNE